MSTTVSDSWKVIVAWMRENAPAGECVLSAPASDERIFSVSSQIGIQFPVDFVALYGILDGAEACSVFPSPYKYDRMSFTPMTLDQILSDWRGQKELVEIGRVADCIPDSEVGIANDWWNQGWIPFASNEGGDYLCIDTAPAETGHVGQIISHCHESGKHKLLAPSLAIYLSHLAEEFSTGRFLFNDEYGIVHRVGEPEVPPSESEVPRRSLWHLERVTIPAASEAFRNRDYAKCVELLCPFEDVLDKIASAKLNVARKKIDVKR